MQLLAMTVALATAASSPAAPPDQELTWDGGGSVLAQAPGFSSQFKGTQARVVRSPTRSGKGAVRFVLDRRASNTDGPRAELSADDVLDGERWYGFSTYLASGWGRDREPDIVTQWHGTGPEGDTGSPSLSLETWKGQWYVGTNPDDEYRDTPIGAYRAGGWTDWVVHVRWADDASGFLELWRDGRRVIDRHGLKTSYTGHPGTYLKLGVYKWPWADGRSDVGRRVLVHDELRVAGAEGSYKTVAPR